MNQPLHDVRSFRLPPPVIAPLRAGLPGVAAQTIEAINAEVPAYAEAFSADFGPKIEKAVRAALGTFLDLVSRGTDPDPGPRLAPALAAAYALGRGEARSGRSLDALLAAYRVGARVAWRELAAISVGTGQPASVIAHFAELVFAYIDELSAASVAGHAAELAGSERERQRNRERLAQALASGEPEQVLLDAAERADWVLPKTLTAVVLPEGAARAVVGLLDARTLRADAGPDLPELAALLVPDAHGGSRTHLVHLLQGHGATVGPPRAWQQVHGSLSRAVRALRVVDPPDDGAAVDTEEHLVALTVTADPQALGDLRAMVLAPLAGEREPAAGRLTQTLRSWLSHQGRREKVAAELFVHPQTVRYRMNRLRELYGDRLRDPDWLMSLTIALAAPAARRQGPPDP